MANNTGCVMPKTVEAPKTGTGFFLPRTPQDKVAPRRGHKARGANQQQTAHWASPPQASTHQMAQLVILQHPVSQQQQLASPFCSSSSNNLLTSSFASSASSSPFAGDRALDSFSLTPCNSGSCCVSPGPFVCDAASLAPAGVPLVCQQPAQQVVAVTPMMLAGAGAGVVGQDLLLLQQQEAEVDAAINDILSLRQQLSTMRQVPAPVATPSCAAPFSVSHATAALGQQVQQVPAGGSSAALSSAQLQLASLQAQQQELETFEERLQAELAAQMVRLLLA